MSKRKVDWGDDDDEPLVYLKEMKEGSKKLKVLSNKEKNRYQRPDSGKKSRLSRTQIEDFLTCKTCFWKTHKQGFKPIPSPGFAINSAIDTLVKKEFELLYRESQETPKFVWNIIFPI